MKKVSYLIGAILLVFVTCQQEKSPTESEHSQEQVEISKIPETFQVTPSIAIINPTHDTILQLNTNGTCLSIEANSFVNSLGEIVETPVALEYREYTNSAEMAFSRIPMTYQHEGEEMNFSSAGMFELSGTSKGEAIEIAKNKELKMDYRLAVQNSDIDFFALDADNNQWKMVQEISDEPESQLPSVEDVKSNREDILSIANSKLVDSIPGSIALPLTPMPIPPVLASDQDDRLIRISFEDENLPEFDQFNKVMFRVSEKSKLFPNDGSKFWHSFDIKKTAIDGEYRLTLDGIDTDGKMINRDYLVNPVFEGEDFEKAQKEYDKKLVQVEKERTRQKEEAAKIRAEQERQFEKQRLAAIKARQKDSVKINKRLSQVRNQPVQMVYDAGHTYPAIVKGLQIASFGVYNCDQIYRVKNPVQITASYHDKQGNSILDGAVLSMVNLQYNGAFSFDPSYFTCSASGNNVLLLFTKTGKLYVLDEKSFNRMNINGNGKYTFEMEDMTDKLRNSNELAKFLGV